MTVKRILMKSLVVLSIGFAGILNGGDGTLPLKLVGQVLNAHDLGFKKDAMKIVITAHKETKDLGLSKLCNTVIKKDRVKSIASVSGSASLDKTKFKLVAFCHTDNEDDVILFSEKIDGNKKSLTRFVGEIDDDKNLVIGEMEILK